MTTTPSDAAQLAVAVLDAEAEREAQQEAAKEEVLFATDLLPRVGEQEVSLREAVRVGTVSTFVVQASSTNEKADSDRPNSSARGAGTRPAATGRASVRRMCTSMSRSMYMFTAFAPPAIKYPPAKTASTRVQLGLPATNMGAIVVTSSSEMIRGFVSATRSRMNARTGLAGDPIH